MAGTNNGGLRGMKQNNRRFPGIKGVRPDQKAIRKEMADERNAAYAALPIEAKRDINPKKFLASA